MESKLDTPPGGIPLEETKQKSNPELEPEFESELEFDNSMTGDMLQVYGIYYKLLFQKNKLDLFENIDLNDETSTNRPLELLFAEIENYKKYDQFYVELHDPKIYREKYLKDGKLPENYPCYLIDINGELKLTHNLISALTLVISTKWKTEPWSITQINNF